MQFDTQTSGLVNNAPDVSHLMKQVLLALLPAIACLFYFYGWGILINLVLSVVFAVVLEALMLLIRKRPIKLFLSDLSAVVTACLFALTLPPLVAWWLPLVGLIFAIVIAKHCYGGIGYNPFNPAMIAYAVLIVSFPLQMSQWPDTHVLTGNWIGLSQSLAIVLGNQQVDWDAITRATPLDVVRSGLIAGQSYTQIIADNSLGLIAAQSTWLWTSIAYLMGGLYLLQRKIIRWQIPLSILLSLAALALLFWVYNDAKFASPMFHLLSGATMIGAFFIATDPVSASTTPLGQIVYGVSIGCFIYIIRTWGAYPDSVAFAVLIMNMAVPLIDYYTQPRVFGHASLKRRQG